MSTEGTGRWPQVRRRSTAVLLLAGSVLLLVGAHGVRVGETWLQQGFLRALQLQADQVGTTLLVVVDRQPVGIAVTAGCSIGPLVALFLLAGAPVVWFRELPLLRVVLSFAVLAGVLVGANQLRIVVIVLSMRTWGIERGYDLAHVFFGSTITTVGFVAGVILFVRFLVTRRDPAA